MKIASIRKRLTENASINEELCIDVKTNKELFNVKQMVRALEEIAEEEQIHMMKEEAAAAQTPDLIKPSKTEESDTTSPLASNPKIKDKKPAEGKVEGGKPKKKSDL
jgi:altronate dehydratase